MFDVLICGGRIVDGAGNPWRPGDVAIQGDRIAALGNLAGAEARTRIDAAGRIVCPGFVDCHSHTDRAILCNRQATSSIYQGVTTEIVGNCGMTYAPVTELNRAAIQSFLSLYSPGVTLDWSSFSEFMDRVQEGIAINLAMLVGHNLMRRGVTGKEERLPTETEMRLMERMVADALDAGAIGLSFALEPIPGRFADQEELRRLCAVAASRNKITTWHIRNRDRQFLEAVQEALDVTRAAGAALQISHLSAKPGSAPRAWNRCMEAVRLARAQGHDVQCDMIPYTTGPGLLSIILPNWASQGSLEDVQARLRDPQTREQLKRESDRYWLLYYHREWDKLTLTGSRRHAEWVGMTLWEIGQQAGRDPFDIVYDILADEGLAMDEVGMNGALFSEGDIAEWLADPLFSIASDGKTSVVEGDSARHKNHPANYGWTPTVIQKYVQELRVFSLETAIHKMTGTPAARFGLYDRGLLRAGMKADVIVFDEKRFVTRSTYRKPYVYAEGMDYVFVNGAAALEKGVPTRALAGRILGR
jgi:N-acyl-D-amino-acid deacylase